MKIRQARPEDAKDILNIYAPYVRETAISFEYEVPDEDEFRRRIQDTLRKYPYLVSEEDGRVTGYAYAGSFKWREAYKHSSEVSIYIARDQRGKGIGRALYEELERLLLKQNVFVLYACITEAYEDCDPYLNDDSIRFHEKMGFRLCGRHTRCGYKFDRWYNMIWMEKVSSDLPDHPDEFIPYDGQI